MSNIGTWGTACRTCRRLGRKCDRTLPSCIRCKHRGVTCEGYVLRWVGNAARGPFAEGVDQSTHHPKIQLASPRPKRPFNRSRMTRIDNNEPQRVTSFVESGTVVPILDSSPRSIQGVQDIDIISPAIATPKKKDRLIVVNPTLYQLNPLMELGLPNDNLGSLITYC